MNAANTLLRAIQNKLILTSNTFEDLNLDDALAGRDDLDFDEKWVRLNDKVKDLELKEAEIQTLDRLREVAFRTTYEYAPNSELPAYVSDDFELIAMGVASGRQDDFLAALLEAYIEGRFPCGPIASSGKSIEALMETLQRKEGER